MSDGYVPPPSTSLEVWVPGRPKTKGSMRVVNGRKGVLTESVEGSKRWRELMRYATVEAMKRDLVRVGGGASRWPLTGPVGVGLAFGMPVLSTGGRAGDLDKLARNVLDALTDAGVYGDDVQVAYLIASKEGPVEHAGVTIRVWDLSGPA